MRNSPSVHPVVDNGIHHSVGHREPVETQIDVLYVRGSREVLMVIEKNEESVIR